MLAIFRFSDNQYGMHALWQYVMFGDLCSAHILLAEFIPNMHTCESTYACTSIIVLIIDV